MLSAKEPLHQWPMGTSPFRLENEDAYRHWRQWKLRDYPTGPEDLMVSIEDPMALSQAEYDQITRLCHKTNMVIYTLPAKAGTTKLMLRELACQLGLNRLDPNMLADEDGITSLTVVEAKSRRGYIPYSNRRLLWHTDGYYNPPDRTIRAMLLHCVRPASQGGENALIDHEMVYLLMRDEDPEMIHALMDPKAMAIPTNTEGGQMRRMRQEGPVFSVDPLSGYIHMRYTARNRSIEWNTNPHTRRATQWLTEFLGSDSPYKFRIRLKSGQGVLCNNVLHSRTAFDGDDDGGKGRLIYRGRFYDRIKSGRGSGTTASPGVPLGHKRARARVRE